MDIVLLIARLIPAFIFGVAGIAKLADREGSRSALISFGVPGSLAAPLGSLLPIAEIVVALALLSPTTAWFGAVAALALLVTFLIGIGVNLARGNSPDCHCFGQLHSEPVSWPVFARNVALAAVAAFIVAQGRDNVGLSAVSWMNALTTGEIVSLIFSVFAVAMLIPMFVMLRRALKQQTALLETVAAMKKLIDEDYAEPAPVEREDAAPPVEGLPVGAMAPPFALPTLAGGRTSLDDLMELGKPALLLFVSPNCSPCKSLLPHVRVWQRDYGDHLTIVVLSKGAEKEVKSRIAKYEAQHLLLLGESTLPDDYQARWTPAAVLIDRRGRIASAVAAGEDAIRALITHTAATVESPANGQNGTNRSGGHRPQIKVGSSLFKVGEPAPRFSLTDLLGREVNLDDLLGGETLLLFWNPSCGFCKAMADDIKRWEANPPAGAPRIVFISSGEAAEVKVESENFKSPFLHDQEFDIGPIFGANGTPSAILIDAEGRISSSTAVGEKNILALLGVRKVDLPIAKGASNRAGKESAQQAEVETVAG
ncbi:MAG: MauE/DoxX family redox-associated membrane protein [Blastocatellales bacterium]